ncbi:MAG TPA: peptidoglycan-binding protein [Bradyrhizobium sp.]
MQQGQRTQPGQGVTTGANTRDQSSAQAQDQHTAQSMSGRFSVTTEQQARLQQALNSRNVARINPRSINFRINSGVLVPRHIAVVSIATAFPALIDIYPDFRDDSFFVVDDDIVVLDRSRRIVDVVPAGPRARFARGGSTSTSGGSVAALNLSPEEIRVVQQVLIDHGMLTGEPDGVLGTRTREALITFQRQQGIQATGSIDTNTVAALGVSSKISATQGQPSTVGQGQGEQPAAAQQNEPATTGQTGTQQPPGQTNGQAATQPPPDQTTGQAAPPAQGNNPPSSNQPSAQPSQNNAPAPSGQPSQNPPSR